MQRNRDLFAKLVKNVLKTLSVFVTQVDKREKTCWRKQKCQTIRLSIPETSEENILNLKHNNNTLQNCNRWSEIEKYDNETK